VPLAGKPGVYQYTFQCTTASGGTRRAQRVESDDRRARRLAELKCAEVFASEEAREEAREEAHEEDR
jgi:hypothetical protein